MNTTPKLTKAEMTKAIERYARRHGWYASTVRNDWGGLRKRAVEEYLAGTSGPTEWSRAFPSSR